MSGDSVKVAVRVRPFNQRELSRQSKLIIEMQGSMTTIRNPDAPRDEPKKFSFDYSYWSHDEYVVDKEGIVEPKPGSRYAGQRQVFDELGRGILDNAMEGYNCSMFAYGQTGSGKSYSMVGFGPNKGIVPIICEELFNKISSNADPDKRFEVSFSMLEIYNEQVRDLLTRDNPKGGLQVRQNTKLGFFYVQNLKKVPVGSYKEIAKRMEQGTAARTLASTNMNATSSRAHTVVTIVFEQFFKRDGDEKKKSSVMNLVDLAGSERADSTGATGDRLKEGANINKSLSSLGNVISALADQSAGKKIVVPYRDSILTKLLKNALGGNSKTLMIAALSPADINYDETLSTLRYADRAKKIQNKAVINENPVDKYIRELQEENERLKKQMESGMTGVTTGLSPAEIEAMRKEMEEEIRAQFAANQELLAGAEGTGTTWEEKLEAARSESFVHGDRERSKKEAHLMNLNEDPLLSGVIFHYLGAGAGAGETTVGRKDADQPPAVCLSGLSIQKQHAVISSGDGGCIEIKPAAAGAKTKVNGVPLTGPRTLLHMDRVLFGSNHLYVFLNPLSPQPSCPQLPDEITWEFAQKEIAQAKGFTVGPALTKDQQIAQEQVLEILPLVSEVTAISEELDKHRVFEVVLISAAAQEGAFGETKSTKVTVKMKNQLNGNTWLWERAKFMNRRSLMQDMYERWLDGDDAVLSIAKNEDPFWEPSEDVLIGTANVFLQSLAYGLDFDDKLVVADYKGHEEGYVYVNVAPCSPKGKPLDEDYFVEDPTELLDKPYYFKVSIRGAEVKKSRFSHGVHVKYRVYRAGDYVCTRLVRDTLTPDFGHTHVVAFDAVTPAHLEFFASGCIVFMLYGVQVDTRPDGRLGKLTTREIREMERIQKPVEMRRYSTQFSMETSGETAQLKAELLLLQKKHGRLEQKEQRMQDLCAEWLKKKPEEQLFEPFHRAVAAVANSSGSKFKSSAMVIHKMLKGQAFIQTKRTESQKQNLVNMNNGNTRQNAAETAVIKSGSKATLTEGSKTCTIQ